MEQILENISETNIKNIPAKSANKKRMGKKVFRIVNILIITFVILIIIFPILWMLPGMFMSKSDLMNVPEHVFPDLFPNHFFRKFTAANFTKIFSLREFNMLSTIFSTLFVAIGGVLGSLVINLLAAYAFARLNFPFKKAVWGYVIITMFIPGITILFTSFRVVDSMGLLNTATALIVPGWISAYNIFFFRQFFYGIPNSIEEAAVIDGSTRIGIFFRMFIPLSVTPMIIIGATVFMGYWNSYLWPTLTITNKNLYQMMQLINLLYHRFRGDYGLVIAATSLSLIVPLIIFIVAQKKIVEGVAITGMK